MIPRNLLRRFVLAPFALIACFIAELVSQGGMHAQAESRPAPATFTARAVAIADGDTITVLRGTNQVRIRLHGIDCPERGQAFGTRAKEFTADLVFGKDVTLRVMDTDRYGRTVAEVLLADGRNVGRELVRAGLAWWYQRYAPADGELQRLETEARAARRGLWADPHAWAPWDWRRDAAAGRAAR